MGLRKYYGEGHEQYWLQWRWWIGVVADGFAGFLIWPAMPFYSVQILMPLVIVMQLATSFLVGLVFFQEKSSWRSNAGLLCSAIGVIGLSLSTKHTAKPFNIDLFWSSWVTLKFLTVCAIATFATVSSFIVSHRSTAWALAAAVMEGVQYLCSRTLASALYQNRWDNHSIGVAVTATFIKVFCILLIVHFSQLGLESDLSRFAGIYLVGCTLAICTFGLAFFGDEVPLTVGFLTSALFTLAGIWLLNKIQVEDPCKADKEQLDSESPCASNKFPVKAEEPTKETA
jgi:hypothetical protein